MVTTPSFGVVILAGLLHFASGSHISGMERHGGLGVSWQQGRDKSSATGQSQLLAASASRVVDEPKQKSGMDAAEADWQDTKDKVNRLPRTVPQTIDRVDSETSNFFPGVSFQLNTLISAIATILIALICVFVHVNCLYTDDRQTRLDRWESQLAEVNCDKAHDATDPDIIIVVHHPDHEYDDAGLHVSREQLDRVLNAPCSDDLLLKLAACRGKALDRLESMGKNADKVMSGRSGSMTGCLMAEARLAILEDLFSLMSHLGFNRTAFASIDRDELFLCCTLRRRSSINHYITRDHIPLEIREDIVLKLVDDHKTVDQDYSSTACSPPLVAFDPALCRSLMQNGIAVSDRETETYRSHNRAGRKTCLSSRDCVGIINSELQHVCDIDAAVDEKVVVGWYPVHHSSDVLRLQTIWANYRAMFDFSFVQPITYIKEYYGARIGFYFAFNGVWCKGFTSILVVAALWLLATTITKYVFKSDYINPRQVIGFSIVLCVWSKVILNMWAREESFFLELWNMRHTSAVVERCRPKFYGTLEPSPLNRNIMEKQYPSKLALLRKLVASFCVILFCALVGIVIWTWMVMFKGKMGMVSSIILSLMIKLFQIIFKQVVVILVEFENHKFQPDWYNSYLVKLFAFDYINNFSAFFFLTISNANSQDPACLADMHACKIKTLEVLRSQVATTLFILAAFSIIGLFSNILIVKFKFWWEDYQYRKNFGTEPPARSYHEDQSKLAKIDDATEVQAMVTLMISLGHALHFGGVAPVALLFSFLVYVMQMRTYAVLLCTAAQRVWPHKCNGIGEWNSVVKFLLMSGVAYTGFLVVAYGQLFMDAKLLGKLTGFLVFCFLVFFLWGLVDLCYPQTDPDENLLAKRRAYVSRLLDEVETSGDLTARRETDSDAPCEVEDAFKNRTWSGISGRKCSTPIA